MAQDSGSTRSDPTASQRGDGAVTVDFERAQRQLFQAVGLEPTSTFVDSSFGRLHVFESGSADADPPVVFVHGTAAFGALFAPLLGELTDARLIAFDRPGYGLSDQFRYTNATIRSTVVTALEEVVDAAGADQIDLVGHSMGGQTALLFALAHPERVRRLTLLGAVVALPGTRPPTPIRLLTTPVISRILRRQQKPGAEGVLDIAEIFGEREAIQQHPAVIQAIAAHEADPQRRATGFSEFKSLVSLLGWRSSIRIRPADLRNLRPPTTVIWGEHDPLGGPDAVRDSIDLIPDVRFEPVDGGHIPYLDNARRCAELIRS